MTWAASRTSRSSAATPGPGGRRSLLLPINLGEALLLRLRREQRRRLHLFHCRAQQQLRVQPWELLYCLHHCQGSKRLMKILDKSK
ncbi:unnamed protein product [Urochloa humidicola]